MTLLQMALLRLAARRVWGTGRRGCEASHETLTLPGGRPN